MTPQGSDGDCVGQGGAARFSPKTADDGGAEKTARHGSIPWRRWSSDGWEERRRVLQLEEATGKVRRGPKGVDDKGKRGGVMECSGARSQGRTRGETKGGHGGDEAPFMGDVTRGDRPQAARRGGVGPAQWSGGTAWL
jgi:hypothetical protein